MEKVNLKKEELIKNPTDIKPHVVLLGAGASRAAFPDGEAHGKKLPIMNDFVEALDLTILLTDNNIDPSENFEAIYSRIEDDSLRKELEQRITKYFGELALPATVTIYDRLLLSLRNKDAIFTFNWDPFLFDAYRRNNDIGVTLPNIFFLHGNVRIGSCIIHKNQWGTRKLPCPTCKNAFTDTPLIYPVEKKDYSKDAYIKSSWDSAEEWLADAFTLTIFGYGAPTSDVDAVKLLNTAWLKLSSRKLEHIEIIDTADSDVLHERWHSFTPTNHYRIQKSLSESRLLQWPRRTCESLLYPMRDGEACEAFPLTSTGDLTELHRAIEEIAHYENYDIKKND